MPAEPVGTDQELNISAARDRLADLVSRTHYSGRITYITRRGQRLAAVVPVEIAEAIERAEDAADVAARAALTRIDAGDAPISLADSADRHRSHLLAGVEVPLRIRRVDHARADQKGALPPVLSANRQRQSGDQTGRPIPHRRNLPGSDGLYRSGVRLW